MRKFAALMIFAMLPALTTAVAQEEETDEALWARLEKQAQAYQPKFPEGEWKLPEGEEWTTAAADYPTIGSAKAVKGGSITTAWESYPPNLRTDGPNSNLVQTNDVHGLVYDSLLTFDPNTLTFVPALATHWQDTVVNGADGKPSHHLFRYRLDKDARWSDGSEVTADDIVASHWHRIQDDRKDPSNVLVFGEYAEVKALDKYTVEVVTKKLNWRLFLYFSGMAIYPAKYVRIKGDEYIRAYQWRLMMGSGPYHIADYERDLKKQQSFTLTRRKDYWAQNKRWTTGLYNFDQVRWLVVRERLVMFEKAKKGELDYYVVGRAQRWAEEVPKITALQKGWLMATKIYNDRPQGGSGLVFNMRKPPFDDLNVRKAFAHLFNREKLNEKLFFNQYTLYDSYFPGGEWANEDNPKVRFDPKLAAALLAKAGYKTRNAAGILVHDKTGEPLEVTLRYAKNPSWQRIWTVVKEDFTAAGVNLVLRDLDWRTLYKQVNEGDFSLYFVAYRGLLFPNPRTSWHSSLADKDNNNNRAGLADERIDRYIERYDTLLGTDARTHKRRVRLIRQIDKLIFDKQPWALGWGSDFARVIYARKFGHPDTYFTRTGDAANIVSMWWYDDAKAKETAAARAADKTLYPNGIQEVRPWAKQPERE